MKFFKKLLFFSLSLGGAVLFTYLALHTGNDVYKNIFTDIAAFFWISSVIMLVYKMIKKIF